MPASIKHLTDKKLNLNSLLAKWTDGLYYTAAIVECDKSRRKCLVCFEDGSEVWLNNRDVHIQLTLDQMSEDEDIVCCICDDGKSEPPNEIILCDVCQQGYHQRCHNPPVDSSKIDESDDNSDHKDWFCATCSYILHQSNREQLSATAHKQQSPTQATPQQTSNNSKPSQAPNQTPQLQTQQQHQTQSKPKPQQQEPPKQQAVEPKQPVKDKSTAINNSQQGQQSPVSKGAAAAPGPVKSPGNQVQKQAPYYPLSSQVRVIATSSTAALASMTASSALVVGSSVGRTKQDLVNQSNRSSQRQRQPDGNSDVIVPPVKHAVRKSSINFVMPPVKQSALPTATRSVLPHTPPPAKIPHLDNQTTATHSPEPGHIINHNNQTSYSNNNSNSKSRLADTKDSSSIFKPHSPVVSKMTSSPLECKFVSSSSSSSPPLDNTMTVSTTSTNYSLSSLSSPSTSSATSVISTSGIPEDNINKRSVIISAFVTSTSPKTNTVITGDNNIQKSANVNLDSNKSKHST